MHETIIFDIDGTLLDSSAGIKSSIKYALNHQKLNMLNDRELDEFVGFSPLFGAFKHFCRLDDISAQACCELYREYYKNGKAYKQSKVYEGVFALLTCLKNKGYNLGVATYKRQDYAKELMEYFGFGNYFESVCGADNENRLKKNDILANCMHKLNAKKETTVLIGDSIHDAQAAIDSGIDFIGVTYGFGFKNNLDIAIYNPLLIVNNVTEITEYFEKEKYHV